MRKLLPALLLAACSAPPDVGAAQEALGGSHSIISTTVTHPLPSLTRTETVVQDGAASTDRFTMTRVRGAGCSKGSILLLPGQQANFELYEVDTSGDYSQGLVGYLATRGYDVWGYSPRSKGTAYPACASDNCPFMSNWGLATIVSDAAYIRSQIVAATGEKPVVGGWSLGAMSTIAVINSAPHDYSGALIWEGLLYSTDPNVLAADAAMCGAVQEELSAGVYAADAGLFALKSVLAYPPAIADPILISAVTTPFQSPPASVPGYTYLAGTPDGTALAYSSLDQLTLALTTSFNDYEAVRVSVDVYCSQAGDRTFTNQLGSVKKPLMVIRTGHGFGPFMDDNLNLIGTPSRKRTTVSHPEFAHGDNYAAVNHVAVLQEPVRQWLDGIFDE